MDTARGRHAPRRDGRVMRIARGLRAAAEIAVNAPARLGTTRLIAVDGPSGSGKTSLADPLAGAIVHRLRGRIVVPQRIVRAPVATASAETALAATAPVATASAATAPPTADAAPTEPPPQGPTVAVVSTDLLATWEEPLEWWPLLDEHLLQPLAAGRAATMPVVQWVSGHPRPGGHIVVPPVDALVLEGVSSGRAAVTDRLSALVWVEVPDAAVRLERAVARDGEEMRPFLARWQRDEEAHFRRDGTRGRADVVIDPSLP